jgi:hypothetical protein
MDAMTLISVTYILHGKPDKRIKNLGNGSAFRGECPTFALSRSDMSIGVPYKFSPFWGVGAVSSEGPHVLNSIPFDGVHSKALFPTYVLVARVLLNE